jgi:hypothetical protein
MTKDEFLRLASDHVPARLRPTGKVMLPSRGGVKRAELGAEAEWSSLSEVAAKRFGAHRRRPGAKATETSADVVFTDSSLLGARPTVVRIRHGKVASILKLG